MPKLSSFREIACITIHEYMELQVLLLNCSHMLLGCTLNRNLPKKYKVIIYPGNIRKNPIHGKISTVIEMMRGFAALL